MPNLEGIFLSGTYFAITYEVENAFGCVLAYLYATMFGLCPNITCWLCELYLECGSHICPVVYVEVHVQCSLLYG